MAERHLVADSMRVASGASSRVQAEVAEQCAHPFDVLFELTKRKTPRAADLLERHGFEERLREREAFVAESKKPLGSATATWTSRSVIPPSKTAMGESMAGAPSL